MNRLHKRWRVLVLGLVAAAGLLVVPQAWAITGGQEAAQAYSFAGSLLRPDDSPRADGHVCGVTLLAPRWALTAAHCTRNPSNVKVGTPRNWSVRIGSLSASSGGQVVQVDKFYAYSVNGTEGDIALLRLKDPVDTTFALLPTIPPVDHTPVRIMGWGQTCDEREPQCYPDLLREADTEIQPVGLCAPDGITDEGEMCIGSTDGSIAATNMDSGGPALVRTGQDWTIVGTVIGGNGGMPAFYTDVHHYADFIKGIVDGTAVPDDSPIPDLEGAAYIGFCSASVVRTKASSPDDPALAMTNGHCLDQRPAPGEAIIDQPDSQTVNIMDREGYDVATATTTRLLYATMTGTDIALFRLDKTYAQLGVKVFTLGTTPAAPGARLDILSGGGYRRSCTIDAVIPHLREGGYQQDDSYRYNPECFTTHGFSGAPLLLPDGITVVGVHNTGNDNGEQCTDNNPCEVAEDGTIRVEQWRSYGQRTTMLPACLTTGSTLDLTLPGCTLPRT